jgi:hypothetical protein
MPLRGYQKKTRPALWTKLRKGLHPRSPQKKPAKKKLRQKPVRKCSPQMRKLLKDYQRVCEVCGKEQSTQIHHKKGRGKLLCEKKFFLAIDDSCHRRIHEHPAWAYEMGYLIRRNE